MYPVSLARFLCVLSVFFVSSVVVALEECDEEFRFDNCFGSWTEHGETWAGEDRKSVV